MLGNSGLQLRPTQQHRGLWEQSKCTSAGLPPARARLPREEQARGNSSATLSVLHL